jgi:hypothetical protein
MLDQVMGMDLDGIHSGPKGELFLQHLRKPVQTTKPETLCSKMLERLLRQWRLLGKKAGLPFHGCNSIIGQSPVRRGC